MPALDTFFKLLYVMPSMAHCGVAAPLLTIASVFNGHFHGGRGLANSTCFLPSVIVQENVSG